MPAATRPTCRRRVLPVRLEEATVLSRAVCPCEMIPAGIPDIVSINGKTYTLAYNATLPEAGAPVVHGYRLTSADEGKVYDLPADVGECSCPDWIFRRGDDPKGCKHCISIRLWKEAGKLA